jgi:3-hydroxyacyl-CoA dehydrogenase
MNPFLQKSTVVGAGLMGGQIGLVLALGSREVVLASRRRESLDRTLANVRRYAEDLHRHDLLGGEPPADVVSRIRLTTQLPDAMVKTEFAVESIPEDLEAKRELFRAMDALAPPEAILTSNTSGLPISDLALPAVRRDRITGSHFVQPGHIVPVVEVIRGRETSEEAMARTREVWERLGRLPLRVNRDVPGFLVNRLQHAIIREAVRLLAEGVAGAEEIDMAVQLGLAPRFTTAGPLEQRDINGLRIHAQVASHLWKTLDGWEEPLAWVKAMVARGEVGLEAGRGYYDWSGRDPLSVRGEKDEILLRRTKQVMADWAASRGSRT